MLFSNIYRSTRGKILRKRPTLKKQKQKNKTAILAFWEIAASLIQFFTEFRQDVVRRVRDFGWVQNQFNPSSAFFLLLRFPLFSFLILSTKVFVFVVRGGGTSEK